MLKELVELLGLAQKSAGCEVILTAKLTGAVLLIALEAHPVQQMPGKLRVEQKIWNIA